MRKLLLLILSLSPTISFAEAPIKIGVLLPLTGDFSYFGEQAKQGMAIALEELTIAGGRKVELVFQDDQCLPAPAVTGFSKLVEVDKVDVVVGPPCSASILSVAPIAQRKSTPVLFLLDAGEQVQQLPDPLYSIGFSPHELARMLASSMIEKGLKKISTVTEEEEYALLITKHFTEKFKSLGGQIVTEINHPIASKDYRTTALNALKVKPDGIFVSTAYETGTFIKQLRVLNKAIPVYGNDTMCVQETIDTAKEAAEDGVCANVMLDESTPTVSSFREKLRAKFGANPNSLFYSALGHDSLKIAKILVEKGAAYLRGHEISGSIMSKGKLSEQGVVEVKPRLVVIKGGKLS